MEDDPADEHSDARARLGLSRETELTRKSLPDPSIGGTRGYQVPDREWQLVMSRAGHVVKASDISLWRWDRRILPFRMTGNKQREGVMGISQLLLVVCITIWPTATHNDIAHFVYREGGGLLKNPVISK